MKKWLLLLLFLSAYCGLQSQVIYQYWFDASPAVYAVDSMSTDSGRVQIDMANLPEGFHFLNIQFLDTDGYWDNPKSFLFEKTEGGVVSYSYWINNQTSNIQMVTIPQPNDTLHLAESLPVPPMPIRTTYFFFEVEDSTPVVHPKNDIRIRFYNDRGHIADTSVQYIDINVTDTVNAQLLIRHTHTSFMTPTNNQLRWFMMQADAGDTLAFRTDECCIMKVFSPNGQEVMQCISDSSVFWNECVAPNSGIYYLAIHDAFVSFPRSMTVWYMYPRECNISVTCDSQQGSVSVPEHVYYNDTIVIAAVPNYGYYFDRWGDGDTDNPRTVHITGDTVFEALFAPTEYHVDVSAFDTNMGRVWGEGTYYYGDTVIIKAESYLGYQFMYWQDHETDNPRQFVLTQDSQFVAYFIRNIGIDCIGDDDILVYPNPTNSSVTIEGDDIRWVTVYSTVGRKMLVVRLNGDDHCTFGLDELPDGIYILDVTTGKGTTRQKVVKSTR